MQIADRVLELSRAAEARFDERRAIRTTHLIEADRGNIWGADDPERVAKRLLHLREVEPGTTERASLWRRVLWRRVDSFIEADGSEEVDALTAMIAQQRNVARGLVTPQFLRLALAAFRCVTRITLRNSSGAVLGYGTGTLVGPGILLTNHHLLRSRDEAAHSEITLGLESGGFASSTPRIVRLLPDRLFITDVELDFTFVGVANADTKGLPIGDVGYISLNRQEGKVINGEFVTIIQHLNGEPKMMAIRECRVVDVLTNFLHYEADTAPVSSGAVVLNDQFEVVAIHHSGVPSRDEQGRLLNRNGVVWTSDEGQARIRWTANEGVRVSALVARAQTLVRTGEERDLVALACDVSRSTPRLGVGTADAEPDDRWLVLASLVSRTAILAGAVLLPIALVYLAFEFALHFSASDQHATVRMLGGLVNVTMSIDMRLLGFVMLMAATGGLVSAMEWRPPMSQGIAFEAAALLEGAEAPESKSSRAQIAQFAGGGYLLHALQSALLGALFGAVFYMLIRATIVTTDIGARGINLVGMQVVSFCVGLFSSRMMKYLQSVLLKMTYTDGQVLQAINRLEGRFDAALSEPSLAFFDGVVLVRVIDAKGKDLVLVRGEGREPGFMVRPGQACTLIVGFVPGELEGETKRLVEPLKIRHGVRAPTVTFVCTLDSDTVDLQIDRSEVTFSPDAPSPVLSFQFSVPWALDKLDDDKAQRSDGRRVHEVYVEVAQKNRLLQSLCIRLEVVESGIGP